MKMNALKILVFLLFCTVWAGTSSAQSSALNRLELYYSQGYYKKVYKQSGKLLDKPENDYSLIPSFYRALSIFQLSDNQQWIKSRFHSYDEAIELYSKLLLSNEGLAIIENHLTEVSALKQDLINRVSILKHTGNDKDADKIALVINSCFDGVSMTAETTPNITESPEKEAIEEFTFDAKNRDEIVHFAEKYLGTPYVYSGTTPTGFDCSGFTSYVMSAYHVNLPRRSEEQYNEAKKIKENKVKKGDLVFFDSGKGVNHVGIIISEQGQPPIMIHASTSKGIVITEITKSDYWKKRLKGYGSVLE